MPPPLSPAELPLIVQLRISSVALLKATSLEMPPPTPKKSGAELPLIVQLLTVSIEYTLEMPPPVVGVAIRNSQAGDGRGTPALDLDMEDAAGMVAINCQVIRTGAVDADTLIDRQSAGRQSNRASDSEVDRVTVMGVRERLT